MKSEWNRCEDLPVTRNKDVSLIRRVLGLEGISGGYSYQSLTFSFSLCLSQLFLLMTSAAH